MAIRIKPRQVTQVAPQRIRAQQVDVSGGMKEFGQRIATGTGQLAETGQRIYQEQQQTRLKGARVQAQKIGNEQWVKLQREHRGTFAHQGVKATHEEYRQRVMAEVLEGAGLDGAYSDKFMREHLEPLLNEYQARGDSYAFEQGRIAHKTSTENVEQAQEEETVRVGVDAFAAGVDVKTARGMMDASIHKGTQARAGLMASEGGTQGDFEAAELRYRTGSYVKTLEALITRGQVQQAKDLLLDVEADQEMPEAPFRQIRAVVMKADAANVAKEAVVQDMAAVKELAENHRKAMAAMAKAQGRDLTLQEQFGVREEELVLGRLQERLDNGDLTTEQFFEARKAYMEIAKQDDQARKLADAPDSSSLFRQFVDGGGFNRRDPRFTGLSSQGKEALIVRMQQWVRSLEKHDWDKEKAQREANRDALGFANSLDWRQLEGIEVLTNVITGLADANTQARIHAMVEEAKRVKGTRTEVMLDGMEDYLKETLDPVVFIPGAERGGRAAKRDNTRRNRAKAYVRRKVRDWRERNPEAESIDSDYLELHVGISMLEGRLSVPGHGPTEGDQLKMAYELRPEEWALWYTEGYDPENKRRWREAGLRQSPPMRFDPDPMFGEPPDVQQNPPISAPPPATTQEVTPAPEPVRRQTAPSGPAETTPALDAPMYLFKYRREGAVPIYRVGKDGTPEDLTNLRNVRFWPEGDPSPSGWRRMRLPPGWPNVIPAQPE
jgi:hypothetical protein